MAHRTESQSWSSSTGAPDHGVSRERITPAGAWVSSRARRQTAGRTSPRLRQPHGRRMPASLPRERPAGLPIPRGWSPPSLGHRMTRVRPRRLLLPGCPPSTMPRRRSPKPWLQERQAGRDRPNVREHRRRRVHEVGRSLHLRGTWGVWTAPAAESSETNSSAHGSFGSPGVAENHALPTTSSWISTPASANRRTAAKAMSAPLLMIKAPQTKHTERLRGFIKPGRGWNATVLTPLWMVTISVRLDSQQSGGTAGQKVAHRHNQVGTVGGPAATRLIMRLVVEPQDHGGPWCPPPEIPNDERIVVHHDDVWCPRRTTQPPPQSPQIAGVSRPRPPERPVQSGFDLPTQLGVRRDRPWHPPKRGEAGAGLVQR